MNSLNIHIDNSVKGSNSSQDDAASLGRECDVRQVIPDRQPATVRLNKNKNKTKIGTWNVRTLVQKGKLDNLLLEMKRLDISILGISEMRWKDQGMISKNGNKIIWSGGTTYQNGVGIILDPRLTQSYKGHLAVSDRILMVKMKGPEVDVNILQVYAPTVDAPDYDTNKFYQDLDKTRKMCKKSEVLIVMGDLNSKVGRGTEGQVVGPHGLGERNDRGNLWVDWCRTNKLIITNTWFQNHPRRLWTWLSPGDRTRNQIDFIAVSDRFRPGILNCKTYPGADIDSDHVPVVLTLRVKLKAISRRKTKRRLNLKICENPETQQEMRENFQIPVFDSNVPTDEQFKEFQNSIQNVIQTHIPEETNVSRKEWMTAEILNMMEERRSYERGSEKYRTINKDIKAKCKSAHEDFLDMKCCDISRNYNPNPKQAHQDIKMISGKRKNKAPSTCIKNKQGELLFEEEKIKERWEEYIGELYDDPDRDEPPLKFTHPLSGPEISKDEIEHALQQMRNGKATGPDEIPIEVIKALGESGIDALYILFNNIYNNGQIPEDMCKSVFIALPKKQGANTCETFRTISLMSHVTKLLLRICVNRMRKKINFEIAEEQYGFQPDKGTRNAIFVLRVLSERAIEVQSPLFICFVDYKKAFDRVKHKAILQQLESIGIDDKDLRLIQNLYYSQTATIRCGGCMSDPVAIKKGVRQGCVASPDLFNLYQETIMRGIADLEGVKVGGVNINNIRYADDTAIIATSETKLQNLMDRVVNDSQALGMEVNTQKTECMVIKKNTATNVRCKIYINGAELKCVKSFRYLGSIVTEDGRCQSEIKSRIAQAKCTFSELGNVLKNRTVSGKTKMNVLKCYVWSTLLYGCESWTLTADLRRRINAFEMWCLRRMERIPYTDHKTNKEVLDLTYKELKIFKIIIERQLSFYGHLTRKNQNEFLAISGKINGKRARGRQRATLLKQLQEFTGMTAGQLTETARDRDMWRETVHEASNAWDRHGT